MCIHDVLIWEIPHVISIYGGWNEGLRYGLKCRFQCYVGIHILWMRFVHKLYKQSHFIVEYSTHVYVCCWSGTLENRYYPGRLNKILYVHISIQQHITPTASLLYVYPFQEYTFNCYFASCIAHNSMEIN